MSLLPITTADKLVIKLAIGSDPSMEDLSRSRDRQLRIVLLGEFGFGVTSDVEIVTVHRYLFNLIYSVNIQKIYRNSMILSYKFKVIIHYFYSLIIILIQ